MATESPGIREVFERALELGSDAERRAYLDAACAGQPELRDRVEALLKANSDASDFLLNSEPTLQRTQPFEPATEEPGTEIGPYKLMEQIGEGGFGLVFVAEQQHPIRRRVALKVIKPGMDTRTVIARFEAERQALALMDHPNIAKVFDAGATSSGRPYFVMELVRGVPITEYCDHNHLTPRERLELFVSVCQAIQHAHQKGIIHRDVKPTNVLVTQHDGRPVAKVIDFGVAKALSQQLTDGTIYTQFAQIIGTPLYMSPEQAEMSSLDIDTRSDIYSLGVLLYELLTGSTPFDRKRLATAAADEIRRIIREEDPPTPSTRFSHTGERRAAVAALRGTEPDKLSKILRGELDWIVMKALDKDRNRRYETAGGFAHDVERYLRNEPVQAGRPSAIYKFKKFANKHFAALSVGIAFVLLLAAATIVSSWQAIRATRAELDVAHERDQVIAEKDLKEEALQAAQDARDKEAQQRALAEEQRKQADEHRVVAEQQRTVAIDQQRLAEERLATGLVAEGDAGLALGQADARDKYRESQDIARRLGLPELSATTGLLASYADQPAPLMGADGRRGGVGGFEGHGRGRLFVAFSPDGRSAASAGTDNRLIVWDVATGRAIRSFPRAERGFYDVAFAPDGASLLTAGSDGVLRFWDLATGEQLRTISGHGGKQLRTIAFSPDGKQLASGGHDFKVRLWNVADGSEIRHFDMPSYVDCVAFSPDGLRLLAGGEPSVIRLWDIATGEQIQEMVDPAPVSSAIIDVAFSSDGRSALSGSLSHLVILWDLASGKMIRNFDGHPAPVTDVAFSPDGQQALSASYDRTVRLWDVASGKQLRVWRGHASALHAAEFSPDGRFILSADAGGAIKLWDLQSDVDIPAFRGHTERVVTLAMAADDRTVLSGSFDKTVRLWDVATCLPIRTIATGDSPIWGVALSRDGRTAVSTHQDGTLSVLDVRTGKLRRKLVGNGDIATSVALSPDDNTAISTSNDWTLRHWDLATGKTIRTFAGHTFKVRNVVFAADGRTALSASHDNTLKLWDVASGNVLRTFSGHKHWIGGVAISPDGRTAASSAWDRQWALWDLATGKNICFVDASTDNVTSVAFSPDGMLLFCGSLDSHVGLWDIATRRQVRNLSQHTDGVTSVAYCSNGATSLSASRDGLMRRWDWERAARYDEFGQSISKAREALVRDPNDADALAVFGQWYAFRGVYDWAAEFMEQARTGGARVSGVDLARCYWQLGRMTDAEREFRKAMELHEAPDDYLALCIRAVSSDAP